MNLNLSNKPAKRSVLTNNTVPLKWRPDCPDAKSFFSHIQKFESFDPIVRTLVREKIFNDEVQARYMIDGFMQWFCTGAVKKTKSFVMFNGPLDQVFHAMILNSKWYFDFCTTFTGVYTHHEPVEESDFSVNETNDAISNTLILLEDSWGAEMHSEIVNLKERHSCGILTISSVSCLGNGGPWDVVPAKLSYDY